MNIVLLLGIAHGVSDAAAGFAAGVLLQMDSAEGGLLIFLYNGLAFGLQPIAGLLLDKFTAPRMGAGAGLILSALGLAVFWLDPRLGIVLIGLGSAFFHAGAGALAIINSPGRASGPGLFAAFGVIGLVLGTRLSLSGPAAGIMYFAFGLILLAIAVTIIRSTPFRPMGSLDLSSGLQVPVFMIVAAFALRSFVWTGLDKPVDGATDLALLIGFSAGFGKLAGGFLSDRIGWLKWSILSLTVASLLLVLGAHLLIPLLLGIFLLQSVTGLTISWLGQALPETPPLAASLALGAAVVIGGLPFVFTGGSWFGAGAILLALPISLLGYWLVLRRRPTDP